MDDIINAQQIETKITMISPDDLIGMNKVCERLPTITDSGIRYALVEMLEEKFGKHVKETGTIIGEYCRLRDKAVGKVTPNQSRIICMKDLKSEPPAWLWKPYLQANSINIIQGDGQIGKSFFACEIAKHFTTGTPFLYGEDMDIEPCNVIYQTNEDQIDYRLKQAGADMSKCFMIDERTHGLTLKDHVIREILEYVRPRLFIVDPLTSYLGVTDLNKATLLRPILSSFKNLAAEYGCTVLLIIHQNKNSLESNPLYRGLGSIDIINIARSVILAGVKGGNRALVHIKCSNSKLGEPIGYEITDKGRFVFTGISELTANDMYGSEAQGHKTGSIKNCERWILDYLSDGSKPARTTIEDAEIAGFTKDTVYAVKKNLKIKSVKNNFDSEMAWSWKLP